MSTRVEKLQETVIQDCLDIVPPTDYNIVDVPKSIRIDVFVERVTGIPYIKGTAFYQLTKKVLVQENKQIYILDKETKNVYQGEYARALLGIPKTKCHIESDYNNRFIIFIQSTSLNRRLIAGTKVLILQ
jgi:hypothetical protein